MALHGTCGEMHRWHCLQHDGETLTQFIKEAVVAAAAWRRVQCEFVTRGEAAIERWTRSAGECDAWPGRRTHAGGQNLAMAAGAN